MYPGLGLSAHVRILFGNIIRKCPCSDQTMTQGVFNFSQGDLLSFPCCASDFTFGKVLVKMFLHDCFRTSEETTAKPHWDGLVLKYVFMGITLLPRYCAGSLNFNGEFGHGETRNFAWGDSEF